jgi:tRNA/tmRNA/rRNA uracil-C5-methylase (TrmA/RlmC/RlmD family)
VNGAAVIADLFAGLGTFALALSGKVYAAEGARDAALALKGAGRGIFVEHRDLFRRPLDVTELNRFEAVVLDPPRAGAKELAPHLAASSVPRLAYVSCNPNTFALALSNRIYAAEGARDAVLALKGARRGLFVEHRDLFRRPLDVAELNRFEAIVLDPPRAGAKELAPHLAASSVPRLAYVSCNPNTFARDAREIVEGGYRLLWIRPVGQFRWSTHVELAAAFLIS